MDGLLRHIVLQGSSRATVMDKERVGVPVTSLAFCRLQNKLVLGSSQASRPGAAERLLKTLLKRG